MKLDRQSKSSLVRTMLQKVREETNLNQIPSLEPHNPTNINICLANFFPQNFFGF